MRTHSADDTSTYIGTTLVNGVLSHTWLSGHSIPVLTGGAGEDDGDGDGGDDGDGDGDDGDDDGDDDDDLDESGKPKKKSKKDDDGDDDDEDDGVNSKNPAIRRASRQAAKYRVRAKAQTTRAEAAEAENVTLKDEVAKLKKDGAGDEALKATITAKETEIAALKADNSKLKEASVNRQIEEQVSEIKDELKLKESPKRIKAILREYDMLEVDEDGEIENLSSSIKKLLKKGELTKVVSDDEDDESGAPSKASGRSVTRGNVPSKVKNEAALAKKYPALR